MPMSLSYVVDIFTQVETGKLRLRDLFAEDDVEDPNAEPKGGIEDEVDDAKAALQEAMLSNAWPDLPLAADPEHGYSYDK